MVFLTVLSHSTAEGGGATTGSRGAANAEFYLKAGAMNRVENLLLVAWTVVLLLLVAFNWRLVLEPIGFSYLFFDLQLRLYLWLILGAFAMPLTLRLLAGLGSRTSQRRSEREINLIKAKAFDGLAGDFETMVKQLQENLENRIREVLTEQAAKNREPVAADPNPAEEAAEAPAEAPAEPTETPPEAKAEAPTRGRKGRKK